MSFVHTMVNIYYLFFIEVKSFDFFGSQNVLTWFDAENYCNTHCNSSLISISSTEDTELQAYCAIMNNTDAGDCWIGISDITEEDIWVWSDGSTVDYGSNISGGVLPWGLTQPNNNGGNQDCGQLRALASPSYAWDDDYCTRYKHLLCNKCYPTLSKYILVNSSLEQSTANQYCRDMFGTELATIQSENDYQEAKLLCNYSNDNCWIGLHDYNTEGNWEWEDGTQNLDFWTNSSGIISGYPWNTGEPNNVGSDGEDCVELHLQFDYFVNDKCCGFSRKVLCNSALDNYICDINVQRELWNNVSCNWEWNAKSDGCGVTSSDIDAGCVTWLGDDSGLEPYKSWADLVMEVTFSMATNSVGTSGLLIRAQNVSPNNDGGQQYYIGIQLSSNRIYLSKVDDGYTHLSIVHLNFTVIIDRYYTIRCELFGDLFKIYVDNVLYITHYDSSYAHGSVGLRSWNQSVTYKKLFISGVEYQPTYNPSNIPTIDPTIKPTIIPSANPSYIPTLLSLDPTLYPTSTPTSTTVDTVKLDGGNGFTESNEFFVLITINVAVIILIIICSVIVCIFFKKRNLYRKTSQKHHSAPDGNTGGFISKNKDEELEVNHDENEEREEGKERGDVQLEAEEMLKNKVELQMAISTIQTMKEQMIHLQDDIRKLKTKDSVVENLNYSRVKSGTPVVSNIKGTTFDSFSAKKADYYYDDTAVYGNNVMETFVG